MARKLAPRTELGRSLRQTREAHRYSQDALGEKLNVSSTIISRWETGRVRPPIESLARFADLIGSTEIERDEMYSTWVRLAGYRGLRPEAAGSAEAHDPTLEGAMGRAIIDQIPDPQRRLDLVLRLRTWARQSPEDGAENVQVRDHRPASRALPAAPDAEELPETQP